MSYLKNWELINASENGNLRKVRQLLENGADKNAKDKYGWTPLHRASYYGNEDVVAFLIEKGANIEAQNKKGETPLHLASRNGHENVVAFLIENDANKDAQTNNGNTALHRVCYWGRENVVKLLLEKGANPNITNNNGQTPLQLAQEKNHQNCVDAIESFLQRQQEEKQRLEKEQFKKACLKKFPTRAELDQELQRLQHLIEKKEKSWLPFSNKAAEQARKEYDALLPLCNEPEYVSTTLELERTQKENEASAKKKRQEELRQQEELNRLEKQQAVAKLKQQEGLRQPQEMEQQRRKQQEEELARKRQEELAKSRQQQEEAAAKKRREEELRKQREKQESEWRRTELASHQNHDNIREQLRLVIEKKRRDPVEVTSSYIDEIITRETLGKGYFGVAYKGFDRVLGKAFALKRVDMHVFEKASPTRVEGMQNSFQNEMNILSKLDHPNIASLYGFYYDPDDIKGMCLIYELAANGSLDGFWEDDKQRERLCAGVTRIRIAYQVARALRYMHEGLDGQAVCFHCDIKSANVCLASDYTVRIIDCGLSKYIEEMDGRVSSTGSGSVGTKGYIAPDYSDGEIRYDSSCDVFSFGVFLCELLTGTTSPSGKSGHYIVFEKKNMKALEHCVDPCVEWDGATRERLVELALKCIKPSGEDRPNIGDVVETLHQLLFLSDTPQEESVGSIGTSNGRNVITVLYSEPLVDNDDYGNLRTFAKLDVDTERAVLDQCLTEACRDIDLYFDSATDLRLLAARIQRPICLHYSGHGAEMYLPFESGRGAQGRTRRLEARELRDLIATDEGQPFKFVFVSACQSEQAGKVFEAAGVPHVVCCEQKSEIGDVAAREFTYQFYLALTAGETVKFSFEQGCMAVTKEERSKFLLLPEDENHVVSIFDAKKVPEWLPSAKSFSNLIQKDLFYPPPEAFVGREIAMYRVVNLVLRHQLVSVVGEKGVGRKSLACAVCHYINKRRSTMLPMVDTILFATDSSNGFLHALQDLQTQLKPADGGVFHDSSDDLKSLVRSVCRKISKKALLVIDGTDYTKGSADHQGLVMFLCSLRETRGAKVLLIGLELLQHLALPEHCYSLTELDFYSMIRLFCDLCPCLDTPLKRKHYREKLVTAAEEWYHKGDVRSVELYHALGRGVPGKIVEKAGQTLSLSAIDGILSTSDAQPMSSGSDEDPTRKALQGARGEVVVTDVNGNMSDDIQLHSASRGGQLSVVRRLLIENAGSSFVDTLNDAGMTPLHEACWHGHETVVLELLHHGATVNARTPFQQTPLHLAAMRGYLWITRLLLGHGANVGAEDICGNSPLHEANRWHGPGAVVDLLIERGADPFHFNHEGEFAADENDALLEPR